VDKDLNGVIRDKPGKQAPELGEIICQALKKRFLNAFEGRRS